MRKKLLFGNKLADPMEPHTRSLTHGQGHPRNENTELDPAFARPWLQQNHLCTGFSHRGLAKHESHNFYCLPDWKPVRRSNYRLSFLEDWTILSSSGQRPYFTSSFKKIPGPILLSHLVEFSSMFQIAAESDRVSNSRMPRTVSPGKNFMKQLFEW